MLFSTSMLGAQSTQNRMETKEKNVTVTTIQQNKDIVRSVFEQSLNNRKFELLNDLISPGYAGVGGTKGVEGFLIPVKALINGFPDVQWKLQEVIGDGDHVVARWKIEGTHTGQYQAYAPTGLKVSSDGVGFYEVKDGKIIAAQVQTDRLGFLQQLHALPQDLTLLVKKGDADDIQFIDKFFVPNQAKQEFLQRVKINRAFIKALPGFKHDEAFQRTDENGNLVFITVAVWENEEAVKKAKESVQAEYAREGFDPTAMFKRLDITIDRGLYREVR